MQRISRLTVVLLAGVAGALTTSVVGHAAAAAQRKAGYRAPRTAWGHPDIHGDYTNKDEANTPLERPRQLVGKDAATFTEADLPSSRRSVRRRPGRSPAASAAPKPARARSHWYEHYDAKNSRPWLVVDPPDGKIPPMTPQAQTRSRGRAPHDARHGAGRADSHEDRSLYDRCITRGAARLDDAGHLRQLVSDHPGAGLRRHPLRDDSRDAHHPARRARRTSAATIRELHGRRARPLGRRHAGRRDDELHGSDDVGYNDGATARSSAGRAIHAGRARTRSSGR